MKKKENLSEIVVTGTEGEEPVRLDVWLAGLGLSSRSQFQNLIRKGLVTVDGFPAKPGQHVYDGQRIHFTLSEPDSSGVRPENIPLDIVFEDQYLFVVNKPAGMVVHPGRGNRDGTLVGALLYYFKTLSGIGGEERPGIIHRLDKNTSGLIICARNDRVHRDLSQMVASHEIDRRYSALLWGHPREENFVVKAPIGRHKRIGIKKMVRPNGRSAETHVKVTAKFDFLSLAAISLETGRTHQIRVHMAHIGHNVFGDPDYGGREERLQGIMATCRLTAKRLLEMINRQALHAEYLSFTHPATGEHLELSCPLPADFQTILDKVCEWK